jgi:hypothetical protein
MAYDAQEVRHMGACPALLLKNWVQKLITEKCLNFLQLVFKGPVGWTEKMTATQLNATECN